MLYIPIYMLQSLTIIKFTNFFIIKFITCFVVFKLISTLFFSLFTKWTLLLHWLTSIKMSSVKYPYGIPSLPISINNYYDSFTIEFVELFRHAARIERWSNFFRDFSVDSSGRNMVTGPQRRQQALISRVGQDVGISIAPPTTFLALFSFCFRSLQDPLHFFSFFLSFFLIYISLFNRWLKTLLMDFTRGYLLRWWGSKFISNYF